MRARPGRLVEVPYQFDDREIGESKMSWREAAGYLVQLRDLYRHQRASGAQERPEYLRLTPAEVETIVQAAR